MYFYFKYFLSFFLSCFVICLLWQCNGTGDGWAIDGLSYKSTKKGVRYNFHIQNKEGRKIKTGDLITFHLLIQNDRDSVIRNTYAKNQQAIKELPFEDTYFIGSYFFKDIFSMLTLGDSISFWINADSLEARSNSPNPGFIKKGSEIKYTVKVLKIESRNEIKKELERHIRVQKDIDDQQIEDFLAGKNQWKISKTASGLRYYLEKTGNGKQAKNGDTISIYYSSRLLNGAVYDSNLGKEPSEFQLGGTLPTGLEEGIALMKEGSKGIFILPSHLGFGSKGMGTVVPPNSVLLYEVELVKVKQ